MNIDVYQDITRKFFTEFIRYSYNDIRDFLKTKFPQLKRVSDPRKVEKPEDIVYEENGTNYGFASYEDSVIMTSGSTSPQKTWVRFNPTTIEYYTIKSDGSMMEEIYTVPILKLDDKFAGVEANYYDEEATKLLLQNRTPLAVNLKAEKEVLSLSPDSNVNYMTSYMRDDSGKIFIALKEPGVEGITKVDGTSLFKPIVELNLYDECLERLGKNKEGIK